VTGLEEYLQPDLQTVQSFVQKEFLLRAGPVTQFIELRADNPEKKLLPALLLAFNKLFNKPGPKVYALAAVFHFISLAAQIHQEDKDDLAYEVLIGDYFYTKFFAYLCDFNALEWLADLSYLICEIQEANILKQDKINYSSNTEKLLEVIDKGKANLYAQSCYIGAQLGGAPENMLQTARKFGLHFGRSLAFLDCPEYLELAAHNLAEARKSLFLLPNMVSKQFLFNCVEHVEMKLLKNQVNMAG
jgi:geranylgeranyl pyrophosphate synthase